MLRSWRLAVRLWLRSPWLAASVIVSLGMSIALGVTMSAILEAASRQAAVFPNGQNLVRPVRAQEQGRPSRHSVPATGYAQWRQRTRGFARLGAYQRGEAFVHTRADQSSRVALARVSGNLFETLGVRPLVGRLLRITDEGTTPCAAVLTERYAVRAFGTRRTAVDSSLTVDGQPCQVVGVVADRHAFPTSDVDLFTPVSTGVMLAKDARGRTVVSIAQVEVIGEPRPDTLRDTLAAEATRYFEAPAKILSFNEVLTASYRRTLDVLWLCSLLVLVVAVFNVASVMATHALTRLAEWGVKSALGASGGTLLRDTIRESAVVCAAGAAAGFTLAWEGLSILRRQGPEELAQATVSTTIWLGWVIVTAILVALTSLPAWWQGLRLSRLWSPAAGGPGTGSATRTPAMSVLGSLLVVCQLAFGIGLVSVTLMFATTLREIFTEPRGFEADDVVMIPTYSDVREDEPGVYELRVARAREALVASGTGVEAVVASDVPVAIVARAFSMRVEDETRGVIMHGERGSARIQTVGPGYCRLMGIRLLAGREFTDGDGSGTAPVVLVSATLARQWFGSTTAALGQSIRVSRLEGSAVIVGVAHDVRRSVWDATELPVIYVHPAQVSHRRGLSSSDSKMIVLVKSDPPMSEHALSSGSLQVIQRNVPGLQVGRPRSVRAARIGEIEQIAVYAGVATLFAAVTLLVLAIGVFGATSHLVARRAREIAIRQAVGATAAQAGRPVATTLVRWWLAASVAGIPISAAGAKLVAASQAGLVPMTLTDITWSVVVITTALVIAAWPPLRRAQRVSPALLMRSD